MLNIGITINIKDCDNIWNNGITQNVINLYMLLLKCGIYNPVIVNTSEFKSINGIDNVCIKHISDVVSSLDLLFILGSQISDNDYNILIKNNAKIIHYCCGSNYFLDAQEVLFKNTITDKIFYDHSPDQIWIIPQNYESNAGYLETMYKKPSFKVPFIWSPTFIDNSISENNIKGFYTSNINPKNIACFEPNIDIVKYALYAILIVEGAYRDKPDLIEHLYVTNADRIKNNQLFVSTMNKLDITKCGVASFESRYKMPYFLDKYTDIVISHQIYNSLNYAYLDALYLNYPLVHNAYLIKDAGYYYDGFDVKKGKEQLLYALEYHDSNVDEYNYNSNKVLTRYMYNNDEIICEYIKLIDNII